MTPMKIATIALGITLVVFALAAATSADPFVGFQPDTKSVTASNTFRTPPITITGATGVTYVALTIAIPQGVTVSAALDTQGNLACVKQGLGVPGVLFHSEWDSVSRSISVSTPVTPGSDIQVLQYIEFSTAADTVLCQMGLSGYVTGGNGTALFGPLTISPPHLISVSSSTATPSQVNSAGTTTCAVVATDSFGHNLTYAWSDGGAGGSFSPSASVANPTYTAASNETGSIRNVTLRCNITCQDNSAVTAATSTGLTVKPAAANTLAVTCTPYASTPVVFTPTPDAANLTSPKPAPVTLSYMPSARGIQVTAPKQDGATNPSWFDHWRLDGVNQAHDQRVLTLDMNSTNHSLVAVYSGFVGDLNGDGHVDKADAQVILAALLAGSAGNPLHDVDQSGTVDINDARWILVHRH